MFCHSSLTAFIILSFLLFKSCFTKTYFTRLHVQYSCPLLFLVSVPCVMSKLLHNPMCSCYKSCSLNFMKVFQQMQAVPLYKNLVTTSNIFRRKQVLNAAFIMCCHSETWKRFLLRFGTVMNLCPHLLPTMLSKFIGFSNS